MINHESTDDYRVTYVCEMTEQESRAAAKQPRDVEAILFGF